MSKELLYRLSAVIELAESWSEDQTNGLTDSEVCLSAIKDIRRIVNTEKTKLESNILFKELI